MDFTIRNNIKLGMKLVVILVLLGLVVSLLVNILNQPNLYVSGNQQPIPFRPKIQTFQEVQQDDFDFGIDENFTQDLLQNFANLLYKGDGSGLLEIAFNLIPIIGTNDNTDALLYPIFLALMAFGVYTMLRKYGYIGK